ncbi:peptide MFS transporter [Aureliella helgolandensis]|uniref:Putative dipeptide and tripeptide permease YjdL n=1 Tax=Aureliella helgolandensis TaxID=2527968 RepID=A0A518G7A6_9BACT|nr:oligopeptide:H+ symporter [Aureliella helgolandensis]QDV24474.1 putative dipeptide and tripeptide permease YjdL [Aureliella helgolandensis]
METTASERPNPAFNPDDLPTLFGHPTGLYTLFFAEMWERFSYYGMRALLVLYMIKGTLGFGEKDANAIYGAYTALVYMTPFFGGMIADRLLGKRTAVIIGGLLMAAGHLMMMSEDKFWFFSALGLLIAGNGFFKPNISSMVGNLYSASNPKRDGGFTLFYIGINLGAALAPLLCGYVGETYGWHRGFGLATIGMLVGLALFVAPTRLTQVLIFITAAASAYGIIFFQASDIFSVALNTFVLFALALSSVAAIVALARGGLPAQVGNAPDPKSYGTNLAYVLVGTFLIIPIFVVLVSGFSVLPMFPEQLSLLPESVIEPLQASESALVRGLATSVEEASRPAGLVLIAAGLLATIYLFWEALRMTKIARERMFVVFTLTFFSIVFWAFFEQQGSSLNNFTDRNIDRVTEERLADQSDVGQTVTLRLIPANDQTREFDYLSQEYLGHVNGSASINTQIEKAARAIEAAREEERRPSPEEMETLLAELLSQPKLTMTAATYLREFAKSEAAQDADKVVEWTFQEESVGKLGIGGSEIPASVFQSVNAVYIMLFGLLFTATWSYLGARGIEPSTPTKFALALLQVALAFGMLYFGAQLADSDGMVGAVWLLLMYLLLTTGELCLSPVGLSMVTKLTPAHLVSTVMGSWFLATAFAQFLAAIIAQYAVVNDGGNVVPIPAETVNVYGDVYWLVAVMAGVTGLVCLAMSPLLKKWMHLGVDEAGAT